MSGPEMESGLRASLEKVVGGAVLSRAEARAAMERILSGAATPAQIGGLLVGMRMRGETTEEIAGFVEALRTACRRLELARPDAVDLCGTGGDGAGTINISTGASLLAAAAGARVAKHGNRSSSSRSGSADVLEAMGVPIDLPPERTRASIEELGFGFLLAPSYHPAMRNAAAPRRELGVRTAFNVLGPLANPAGVRRQLIGVCEDGLRRLMGQVLLTLGTERVWLVHAPAGTGAALDEVSIEGPTQVTVVEGTTLREGRIVPEDAGLARRSGAALRGGDPAENGRRLEAALSGEPGADRDSLIMNAACALVIAGVAADLRHGSTLAAGAIDRGAAASLLEKLRRFR